MMTDMNECVHGEVPGACYQCRIAELEAEIERLGIHLQTVESHIVNAYFEGFQDAGQYATDSEGWKGSNAKRWQGIRRSPKAAKGGA